MKNKLTDLNDHLMAQIERLCEEGIGDAKLETEIARSKALAHVATSVIENARLILEAAEFADRRHNKSMPKALELLS